jgi:hypothetical protein
LVLRQDLVMQIPSLKKKYLHYRDYMGKTMSDIFGEEQLKSAFVLNTFTLETIVWINDGKGTFSRRLLPAEAQFFPVYALSIEDYDADNNFDILMGGNLYRAKPETGIYAAGYGLLLKGDGSGNFKAVSGAESGLSIAGEIRGLKKIKRGSKSSVLIAKNSDKLEILNLSK